MSQNPPKTQAQIDAELESRRRVDEARRNDPSHAPFVPAQTPKTQAQIDTENRREAAEDRGPAPRTGMTQDQIDAEARRQSEAAKRAPESPHPSLPKTQEQINAENEVRRHAAANPVNDPSQVLFGASPAKQAFPDSPVPGDTFHRRDAPLRTGTKTGPLPSSFPGWLQLKVAGFPTYETARTIVNINAIAGIDGPTAKLIEALLADEKPTASTSFSNSHSGSASPSPS